MVIIFHLAQDEREDAKGKYKIDTINVGGKAGKSITAWADHILHMKSMYVGDQLMRKMITRGSRNIEAGTRMKGIPPEIVWKDNMEENYNAFRKLFN